VHASPRPVLMPVLIPRAQPRRVTSCGDHPALTLAAPAASAQDLTSLGLNLNSNECLYATFSSPWGDPPVPGRPPEYVLPSCYYTQVRGPPTPHCDGSGSSDITMMRCAPPSQPPNFKLSHLPKLALKTLFYMFYQMPRDVAQVRAAERTVVSTALHSVAA
jgi:hypothetical protein